LVVVEDLVEVFLCLGCLAAAGAVVLVSFRPLPLTSLRLLNKENDSRGSTLSLCNIDGDFDFDLAARCHGGNDRLPCLVAGEGCKGRELSTSERYEESESPSISVIAD
jgi:hypothetical protein